MTKGKTPVQDLPNRFTISSELLNHALGFLSLMPVYQSMELITRINMDITPVADVVGDVQGIAEVHTESKPEPKTVELKQGK